MRTTVSIDDEIYEEARRIAFESRRTLGSVVNDLLAAGLQLRLASRPKRELGQFRGSVIVADDFDKTPADLVDAFETDL